MKTGRSDSILTTTGKSGPRPTPTNSAFCKNYWRNYAPKGFYPATLAPASICNRSLTYPAPWSGFSKGATNR